jgi:crotonobetainyl-CoA:carnitine CoA-transferase CaiB-like acyl-CoA transferase
MEKRLPLSGIRVLEFTHAVMGPTTGLLLADMGAEVIHVEPPEGDHTRRLPGFGTGYFSFYSRNKKSLAVDLKTPEGKNIIYRLVPLADIAVENFGPGTMERLGLGPDELRACNKRLIYCSLKGFLSGPYQHRHAMDEVVQMMGGLAYMTGRPGDPLRAGTSIVDISGGMFGFIGVLLALLERERTGEGKLVKAALFETVAFLMGQHMAYATQIDHAVPPMPARVSAWSIYQVFDTSDGEKIFIGIISEKHWERFCSAFGWQDWLNDERLRDNQRRIEHRAWFLPALEERLRGLTRADIARACEAAHIPFAPIARPEDLFDDPQLNAGGSLLNIVMPNGVETKLPKTPLEYEGLVQRVRHQPPDIGAHTAEILRAAGYAEADIAQLAQQNIIKVA